MARKGSLLTGKDNESLDVGRVGFLLTLVTFLILVGYVVSKSGVFDMQGFGIAVGAIFTAGGAMLKLKENTEPTKDVSNP